MRIEYLVWISAFNALQIKYSNPRNEGQAFSQTTCNYVVGNRNK